MPFIRVQGHQLALVHGSRREGKVVQEVLFTLYSKAEAREALGLGSEGGAAYFERVVAEKFPKITFNWDKVRAQIAEHEDHLPEIYDHGDVRLRRDFREALAAFTRQLLLADPQSLDVAANLLNEHRAELGYLQHWLGWRRDVAAQRTPSKWSRDNPFLWKYTAFAHEVPHEPDGEVHDLFEKGDYDAVVPRAQLLVEAFPNYADGFNLLGLVALERNRLPEAIGHFERTVEVGRTLFPKRVAKDSWWGDISTRPYMRGLGNLALALSRAGRFEDALAACDELDRCAQPLTVPAHRAAIFLNLGRHEESAACSRRLFGVSPSSGFALGFALDALGRSAEARAFLLHAVLNHPRAARRLVGLTVKKPVSRREWEDDRLGANLSRDLHPWLARLGRKGLDPLRHLLRHPRVDALVAEVGTLEASEAERKSGDDRTAFDRLLEVRSAALAEQVARDIGG